MNEHIAKLLQAVDRAIERLTRWRATLLEMEPVVHNETLQPEVLQVLVDSAGPNGAAVGSAATPPHRRKYKKRKTGGGTVS